MRQSKRDQQKSGSFLFVLGIVCCALGIIGMTVSGGADQSFRSVVMAVLGFPVGVVCIVLGVVRMAGQGFLRSSDD